MNCKYSIEIGISKFDGSNISSSTNVKHLVGEFEGDDQHSETAETFREDSKAVHILTEKCLGLKK